MFLTSSTPSLFCWKSNEQRLDSGCECAFVRSLVQAFEKHAEETSPVKLLILSYQPPILCSPLLFFLLHFSHSSSFLTPLILPSSSTSLLLLSLLLLYFSTFLSATISLAFLHSLYNLLSSEFLFYFSSWSSFSSFPLHFFFLLPPLLSSPPFLVHSFPPPSPLSLLLHLLQKLQ